MNHFFYISKQGETEDGRNSIVYYRLKEFTLGKISVYETWKEKQFSLNCHVLNGFFLKSVVKLILNTLKSYFLLLRFITCHKLAELHISMHCQKRNKDTSFFVLSNKKKLWSFIKCCRNILLIQTTIYWSWIFFIFLFFLLIHTFYILCTCIRFVCKSQWQL